MTWQGASYAGIINGRTNGDLHHYFLNDKLLNTLQDYDLNPSNLIFSRIIISSMFVEGEQWLEVQDFLLYGLHSILI